MPHPHNHLGFTHPASLACRCQFTSDSSLFKIAPARLHTHGDLRGLLRGSFRFGILRLITIRDRGRSSRYQGAIVPSWHCNRGRPRTPSLKVASRTSRATDHADSAGFLRPPAQAARRLCLRDPAKYPLHQGGSRRSCSTSAKGWGRIFPLRRSSGWLPAIACLVPFPVTRSLGVGQRIIFGGRRWRVREFDTAHKAIYASADRGGAPPSFESNGGDVHDVIRREMRVVLAETSELSYLDATAKELLYEARRTYQDLRLCERQVFRGGKHTLLFTWMGDAVNSKLAFTLAKRGLECTNEGVAVVISTAVDEARLVAALSSIAPEEVPSASGLGIAPEWTRWRSGIGPYPSLRLWSRMRPHDWTFQEPRSSRPSCSKGSNSPNRSINRAAASLRTEGPWLTLPWPPQLDGRIAPEC
jgi:hypothetical protein